MFIRLLKVFVLLFVLSPGPSWGATLKCSDFDKEANKFKTAAAKKETELGQIEKQLKANTTALDEYNKNCRAASSPKCNPMMYNMISGQTVVLSGKHQSFANEILVLKSKQDDALEKKKACHQALKKNFL